MFKRTSVLVTSCVLFLSSAKPLFAQVVINEVFPAPSIGSEWAELFNAGTEPVTLTNWQLRDQLTTPSTLYIFPQTVVNPQSFLTIDVPSAKLNNSGDGVTLLNESGHLVDEMSYTSSQTDLSWARLPNSSGPFFLTTPTKNTANPAPPPSPPPSPSPSPSPTPSPIPSPTSSPTTTDSGWWHLLTIESLMACPTSGQLESATIYNNDDATHDLAGWRVSDESNTRKTVSGTLNAHQSLAISWSGSMLNNSGDTLELLSPDDTVIDSLSYTSCQSGMAVSKTSTNTSATTNTATSTSQTLPIPNPTVTPSLKTFNPPISYSYTPNDILLGTSSATTSSSLPSPIITNTSTSPSAILPLTSVILGGTVLVSIGSYGLYQQIHAITQRVATSSVVGGADLFPILTE